MPDSKCLTHLLSYMAGRAHQKLAKRLTNHAHFVVMCSLLQALTSRETVNRLMSKSRKYQAQLEERRHLQQLLDGMASGQQDTLIRFKNLLKVSALVSPSGCMCLLHLENL